MTTHIAMIPQLTECPHCGSDEFYVRVWVHGTITERHRFDGEPVDNTGMMDYLHSKQRKTIFCGECDAKIARAL